VGLFWAIFQLCAVVGNAVAYFVFNKTSSTVLYVVFTATGAVGVVVLAFLRPLPELDSAATNTKQADPSDRRVSQPTLIPPVSSGGAMVDPSSALAESAPYSYVPSYRDGDEEYVEDAYDLYEPYKGPSPNPLTQPSPGAARFAALSPSGEDMVTSNYLAAPLLSSSTNPQLTPSDVDTPTRRTVLPNVAMQSPSHSVQGDVAAGHGVLLTDVTPSELILDMLKLFRRANILLLLPCFFLTGFELAFWSGEFTQLLDQNVIGLVLMFTGFGEIFGGIILGHLSDALLGRSLTQIIGVVLYGTGLGLVVVLKELNPAPHWHDVTWVAFIAAFCFGVGDSIFNTQGYALVGHLYHGKDSVGAFTIYQLFQNFGSAAGFYYSPLLPVHGANGTYAQIYILGSLLLVSGVLYVAVDQKNKHKKQRSASVSPAASRE
jgi:hypothetical protein